MGKILLLIRGNKFHCRFFVGIVNRLKTKNAGIKGFSIRKIAGFGFLTSALFPLKKHKELNFSYNILAVVLVKDNYTNTAH